MKRKKNSQAKLVLNDYATLLAEVKERIRTAQYAALRAVNKELIALYWDIGRMIVARQQGETWGKSVVEKLVERFGSFSPVGQDAILPPQQEISLIEWMENF